MRNERLTSCLSDSSSRQDTRELAKEFASDQNIIISGETPDKRQSQAYRQMKEDGDNVVMQINSAVHQAEMQDLFSDDERK